jgi:hypothetical protein
MSAARRAVYRGLTGPSREAPVSEPMRLDAVLAPTGSVPPRVVEATHRLQPKTSLPATP